MFDFRMFDKFDRKFNQAKKFMSTNQVFAGLDTQGWSRPRPQRPEERPMTRVFWTKNRTNIRGRQLPIIFFGQGLLGAKVSAKN